MAKLYELAEEDVWEKFNETMEKHFPLLLEEKVTFEILMASNPDGPAIKHQGNPAYAQIKVIKDEERAKGAADMRLKIDKLAYEDFDEEEREALIYHELRHVVIKRKKNGSVKLDPYGRPVTGCCHDDYTINGFKDAFDRFGAKSIEYKTFMAVKSILFDMTATQYYMARGSGVDSANFLPMDRAANTPAPPSDEAWRQRKAEVDESFNVPAEATAALVAVGHTELSAREAVNKALAGGQTFATVAELVDAIYQQTRDDINAELNAGVREVEAAKAEETDPAWEGPPEGAAPAAYGWRFRPVSDLGLLSMFEDQLIDLHFQEVGGLVDVMVRGMFKGSIGLQLNVMDALERFRGTLSTEEIEDFDRVRNAEHAPAKPKAERAAAKVKPRAKERAAV